MVGEEGPQGNLGQEEGVCQGNQGPDHRQHLPPLDAEQHEEEGAADNHGYMAPAVEGVEEAHGPLLVFRGAGFGHGADDDLQQAAAQGIGDDGDGDSHLGIQQLRQQRQLNQASRRKDMGHHRGRAVAHPVQEAGGNQVHRQLQQEVRGDEGGNPFQGHAVVLLEGDEQQGDEGVDDGLHHGGGEAGAQGGGVGESHGCSIAKWRKKGRAGEGGPRLSTFLPPPLPTPRLYGTITAGRIMGGQFQTDTLSLRSGAGRHRNRPVNYVDLDGLMAGAVAAGAVATVPGGAIIVLGIVTAVVVADALSDGAVSTAIDKFVDNVIEKRPVRDREGNPIPPGNQSPGPLGKKENAGPENVPDPSKLGEPGHIPPDNGPKGKIAAVTALTAILVDENKDFVVDLVEQHTQNKVKDNSAMSREVTKGD